MFINEYLFDLVLKEEMLDVSIFLDILEGKNENKKAINLNIYGENKEINKKIISTLLINKNAPSIV